VAQALSRRDVLKGAGGAAAGSLLVGRPGGLTAAAQEAVELRFAHFLGGPQGAALQQALDEYAAANPGVTIVSESTPGTGWVQYLDKVRTAIAGGAAPDMFMSWGGSLGEAFVDTGQTLPMAPYYEQYGWDEILVEAAVDAIRVDGELYGVPVALQSMGLWYRTDVFANNEIEIPQTFAELEAAATTLKEAGVTPLSLGGKFGWNVMRLVDYFLEVTAGPELKDQLLRLEESWDRPEVVETYTHLQRWVEDEWIVPGFLAVSPDDARVPFYQGQAAMVFEGNWLGPIMTDLGLDLALFDFFAPPTDRDPLRISAFPHQVLVAQSSEHPDAAAAFLNWYIQPDTQAKYFQVTGSTATIGAVPEDDAYAQQWQGMLRELGTYPPTDQIFDAELMGQFFAVQGGIITGDLTPAEGAAQMEQAAETWRQNQGR
jgi:raffinose/stachyose/melibiose transport system substrate-binding protein